MGLSGRLEGLSNPILGPADSLSVELLLVSNSHYKSLLAMIAAWLAEDCAGGHLPFGDHLAAAGIAAYTLPVQQLRLGLLMR
jgi:hypothetical protein